jgi:transposase
MLNSASSPEERRLVILSGLGQDLTNLEIATKMGVKISVVKKDLRAMKYNRDSDLKQAYTDKEKRALKIRQKPAKERNERFKLMTGMTFQKKNFENMVNYYRPELIKILRSKDENAAIMRLPKNVQRTLTRNEITDGLTNKRQISSKARDYLPLAL